MLSRRHFSPLDAYMAELVDRALASGQSQEQRLAVLQCASQLTRRIAKSALQSRLLTALERGRAPKQLPELQQFVESSRFRWTRAGTKVQQETRGGGSSLHRSTEPMLTPAEVARELGLSTKTVANWCDRGLLRCEPLPSGHRRIPASALDAYRTSQAKWDRLDAISAGARAGAPEPDESAIFAELSKRRG
jgi:excisionase family DNA binding protein